MAMPGGPSHWQASTPALASYQNDFHTSLLPELDALAGRHKAVSRVAVMRVAQLDAGRLDGELTSMLQEQLAKAFAYFRPGLLSALQPEVSLLMDILIFSCSVWVGRPTPGSALMNLRYRNERAIDGGNSVGDSGRLPQQQAPPAALAAGRAGVEGAGLSLGQRAAYGGLIVARYVWARTSATLATRQCDVGPKAYAVANAAVWCRQGLQSDGAWVARTWRIMQRTEAAARLASLANLLLFLKQGVYRSVGDRLVGARLVLQRASMARALSFEYLNRQLVWTELSELLLFLLPLLNVTQLRSRVTAFLPRATAASPNGPILDSEGDTQIQQTCSICSSTPILRPYAAQPCQHIFCYYCLRANTQADAGYKCVQCASKVTALKPAAQSANTAGAILRTL